MLEYGKVTGLPGNYRIALALSVALLLHTLVMSVLPFTLPETEAHRRTVRVELISPGSEPATESTSPTASKVPETQPADSSAEMASPEPSSRPEIATPDSSRNKDSEPGEAPQPSPQAQATDQPSADSAPARASTASAVGSPKTTAETEPEPITQITPSPRETDTYIASLAARVGKELDKRPVPSSRQIAKPVTMELELTLMGSGALTSARVTRSTGFSDIDQTVYRAALLASPYPQPPDEYSGRKRFRVELIFSPERL